MRTWLRGKVTLLFMTCAVLLAIPAIVLADNVQNDVVATAGQKIVSVQAGQTTGNVGYQIAETGGDSTDTTGPTGQKCNPAVTPAKLTLSGLPTGVDVKDPTSGNTLTAPHLTFTTCGTYQYVKFAVGSSVAAGDYPISVSDITNNGFLSGDFNESPANFTLRVTTAPPSDTTAPVIDYTLDPATPDGSNGWYKSAVTLTWSVTDPESAVTKTGCVDQNITADQVATTYSCSATSSGGSAGPVDVTIKRDGTAPTGVSGVLARATADHNGWYNAPVGYSFSGSDATSGIASCSDGTYSGPDSATASIDGSCTDNAGNSTSATISGFKFDDTNPTLNPSVSPNPVLLNGTATATPNANDATSGVASQSCPTVDTSVEGSHSVSCTATDNAGNTNSADANYSVKAYGFIGFSSPVDNGGVFNVAKAGQAIPLKWRLMDGTSPVTNLSNVTVTVKDTGCSLGTSTDQVEEYAAGSSGLQNLGDGYYQFNWKSPTGYAKSCKTLTVKGLGLTQQANFQFTK